LPPVFLQYLSIYFSLKDYGGIMDMITSSIKKKSYISAILHQCDLEIHAAGSVFNLETLPRAEAETVKKN